MKNGNRLKILFSLSLFRQCMQVILKLCVFCDESINLYRGFSTRICPLGFGPAVIHGNSPCATTSKTVSHLSGTRSAPVAPSLYFTFFPLVLTKDKWIPVGRRSSMPVSVESEKFRLKIKKTSLRITFFFVVPKI